MSDLPPEDKKTVAQTQPKVSAPKAAEKSKTVTSIEARPTKGYLRVKIYTPFKTFYEGDARSLTALNESGPFDVLPGHHNFITMLRPCDIHVETPEKKIQKFPIVRGLMHVRQDKLIIFLDI